ncbi:MULTISPECIES: HesA/MoeB/ThiF family protein [unclassified Moritella]|uniref:HesA/MoeB/ThiF family protein n=1 Tax=unclassified Moritella TaxID=2637987 RepID=UPI001BADC377|nr:MULTISPECIES: HesA/MoeB/ThiF family protein [unclassified Moritella]QUM82549.1 HesA/MoeB/ThiF family protein [Moritella sp. 5]QUM86854.1 HesA/MoeB/ThiF family protein [Moritella sp. 28]
MTGLSDQEYMRYSAHLLLSDIGEQGQLALRNAKVLIVGVGGLGAPVALYLASAGVGHLYLADDDHVELSNLQRQIIFTQQQLKQMKVSAAKASLAQLNPHISVTAIAQRVTLDSANHQMVDMLAQIDLVIDCSDNMLTRQAINKICVTQKLPLIVGAGIRMEGQLISFNAQQTDSACYHCLYPFEETAETNNCSTSGVLGPLVGVIGSLQALEAIKYLTSMPLSSLNRLMRFDGKTLQWQYLSVTKNPDCSVCAGR